MANSPGNSTPWDFRPYLKHLRRLLPFIRFTRMKEQWFTESVFSRWIDDLPEFSMSLVRLNTPSDAFPFNNDERKDSSTLPIFDVFNDHYTKRTNGGQVLTYKHPPRGRVGINWCSRSGYNNGVCRWNTRWKWNGRRRPKHMFIVGVVQDFRGAHGCGIHFWPDSASFYLSMSDTGSICMGETLLQANLPTISSTNHVLTTTLDLHRWTLSFELNGCFLHEVRITPSKSYHPCVSMNWAIEAMEITKPEFE